MYSPLRHILWATTPWMLLATTLRTVGVVTWPDGKLLFSAAEFALFIAFLLASQRSIELTGGNVSYAGMGLWRQLNVAKGVLLRIALLGYAAYYAAWYVGVRSVCSTPVVYGFDAIAFNRFNDFMLAWGPAMALATYLMVAEQATGRSPTFAGGVGLLSQHWRFLLPATALLIPALVVFNSVQWSVGPLVRQVFEPTGFQALTAAATIVFLFAFASLRLVGTVLILTLALKASYKSLSRSA